MTDEGWTVVGKKGKSSGAPLTRSEQTEEAEQAPFLGDCTDTSVCCQSINLLTEKLRSSGFYLSLKAGFAKSGGAAFHMSKEVELVSDEHQLTGTRPCSPESAANQTHPLLWHWLAHQEPGSTKPDRTVPSAA